MADNFMPHGMCFLWQTDVLLLHVLSDAGIAAAYFSIPLAILHFVRHRPDLEYKWLFGLFALFIVACGVTHMLGIWVIWNPDYRLEGSAKAATAGISVLTAIVLWPLLPKVLALPGPAMLTAANAQLAEEVEARRATQRELENLNADLERRVAERTAALARSNEDLEKFAYHASHDLRAPLRAVATLSQFVEQDLGPAVDPEAAENMALMRTSIRRMERMLEDLLSYSRIAHKDGGVEQYELGRIITDAIDLVALPDGFEATVDCGPGRIRVARVPLQQALQNIIANAVKHHDRDRGQIAISARETGTDYVIDIEDDGPGIPEKFHKDIFDLFRTLKVKDDPESSGMGLSIAQRAMARLGGTISVEMAGPRGTRFSLRWPKELSA